jgi:hypothetical protein
MAELKALVIAGPDPEKDGVVRWRCVDLRVKIADTSRFTTSRRLPGFQRTKSDPLNAWAPDARMEKSATLSPFTSPVINIFPPDAA